MEWTTPEFVEVSMDAEIGRYQQDDNGL